MSIVQIKGILEIDPDRGIIYFHSEESGRAMLRITALPIPVPLDGYGHKLWNSHTPCELMLKVGDRVIEVVE
jgi:hypothetical protein